MNNSAYFFNVLVMGCNASAYIETSGPLRFFVSVECFPSHRPGLLCPEIQPGIHSFTQLLNQYLQTILRQVKKLDQNSYSNAAYILWKRLMINSNNKEIYIVCVNA